MSESGLELKLPTIYHPFWIDGAVMNCLNHGSKELGCCNFRLLLLMINKFLFQGGYKIKEIQNIT